MELDLPLTIDKAGIVEFWGHLGVSRFESFVANQLISSWGLFLNAIRVTGSSRGKRVSDSGKRRRICWKHGKVGMVFLWQTVSPQTNRLPSSLVLKLQLLLWNIIL
jgi:hypothetical protein